jgi:flagellar biosynthesis chaperone FliJ
MEKLRELAEIYEELTNDLHQQFVGNFEYEELLSNVRKQILELEKTLKFDFKSD